MTVTIASGLCGATRTLMQSPEYSVAPNDPMVQSFLLETHQHTYPRGHKRHVAVCSSLVWYNKGWNQV